MEFLLVLFPWCAGSLCQLVWILASSRAVGLAV